MNRTTSCSMIYRYVNEGGATCAQRSPTADATPAEAEVRLLRIHDGRRRGQHADRSAPYFAIVGRDDVRIFFSRGDAPLVQAEGAYSIYFHIADVDALADELRGRGVQILEGPEDRVYGQRELVVRDCNGVVLCFAEAIEETRAATS